MFWCDDINHDGDHYDGNDHNDDLQSRHVEMLSIVDLYIYTLYDPLKCQTFQEPAAKFSLQTFPGIFLLRMGFFGSFFCF